MVDISSFIKQWPTRSALAADIGINTDAVHKWAQTKSIPAKYHLAVLRSAETRGIEITALDLAEMHAAPRSHLEQKKVGVA